MGKVRVINRGLCFLFINVLMLMYTKAQDTTLIQRFDLKTKNLNKSEMRTKVLYDRVYPFAKLNKQLYTEKERALITKNYQYWKQVYLELYNASYQNNFKDDLIELQEKVLESKIQLAKTPIAFIHYQYEYIDTNAYNDGRLEIRDDELYSTNNAGNSVYLLDTVSLLSVMSDEIQTGEIKLYFNNFFFFTNCQEKVKEIQLTLKDRNTIRLSEDDSTTLVFNTAGKFPLMYTVYYADGTSFSDTTYLKIVDAGTIPCEYRTGSSTQTFLDYENKLAGCNYELGFYYNTCQARNSELLYKPILVLDGFDPSDSRKVGNIYDLMNAAPVNLASYLRSQGHDIIIMNFPKGADYLERNALGVMQMIEYIKARTNDKLIVIGPSMGGLLAKYSIAKLEEQNIDHQVGLYVSFDAPHQGANIPIGAQYFLKFFGENIGNAAALEGLQKVKSPAARQMLIHHYLSNSIYPLHDSYRNKFKLTDLNYPVQSRNVALINGAENTKEQGLSNELFSLYYNILFNNINVANAKVYKSSTNGLNVVADLSARNPNKLFIKENMYKFSSPAFNHPTPSSLDDAPGGTYNTQYQLTHDQDGNLMDGFTMNSANHCFIPSVSALDVQFPDGFVNYKFDIKNAALICNNSTPFKAYHASSNNEEHVAIHEHSENWIKRELRNGNRKTELTSIKTFFKNNDVYNYGANTKDFFSKPFTFSDGALFGVNMNSATGYANESIPAPVSQFTVDAYNASCTTLVMEIKDRAKIQLGDVNKNIGILKISENTKLYLHDYAELLIHDYSTLIIEKGSSLNIGKNVNVKLLGKNAKIIVYGQLIIEEDAIFSFSGDGVLVLNTKDVILKRNAHISIHGKNKNDLKLQVINGNKIPFPMQPSSNNSIRISNAKIQFMGDESYINSAIPINLEETTIEGGRGIILNGQKDVSIKNCEFLNNKNALTYYANNMEGLNQPPTALILSDNTFINSKTAIEILGKGFVLKNIRMLNVEKAIVAHEMEWPSSIINSTISASENQASLVSNNAAINFYGQSGSSLLLLGTKINDFTIGVFVSNASLNLKCSEVINCRRNAIYLHNGASLNMAPSVQVVAGNNTLSIRQAYNNSLICLDQAGTIRIDNGANKFKLTTKNNVYFIAGTSKYIPNTLSLQRNNWYTSSTSYENNPSSSYFYISQSTAPASPRIQNFITLPILANDVLYECNLAAQQNIAIPITNNTDCLKDYEQTTLLNNDNYQLKLSHQCYLKWYASTAAENKLTIDLVQQKLSHLLEYKNYIQAINDTEGIWNANIDFVQYCLNTSDFDKALTSLNSAYNFCEKSTSIQYLNYLSCLIQCRKMNQSHQYSLIELDSLLQSCKYEYNISTTLARINKNQINAMEVKPIDLIPNPTDRFFDVVVNDDAKIFSVSVFSQQGELLSDFAVTHTDKLVRVDMEGFSPGVYLVSIKTSEKEYIRKVILISPK